MITVPFQNLYFEWMPLLTAQLVFIVLLYFSVFSRRTLVGFPYHVVFLFCFGIYLLGKPLQSYTEMKIAIFILFFRTFLFLGIALPSLVVALCKQCDFSINKSSLFILFIGSALSATVFISVQDIVNYNYFFSSTINDNYNITNNTALIVITFHLVTLLMLPCVLLAWRELKNEKDPINLAFLSGAFVLFLSQFGSAHILDTYWLLYVGAIFTACCWLGAVYFDMYRIRGRAHAIQDELLLMLRKGTLHNKPDELDKLWRALDNASEGDIQRYKLQVREILLRLAEMGIGAGASGDVMLARASESSLAIEKSLSASEIRAIATQEVLALGELVEDTSVERNKTLVEKAQQFINKEFATINDVNEVAQHCSVSRSHLMRHFKDITGQTINQYLINVRIEAAKTLLLQMSVTETAFAVGFNNSNYFSTVFKKITRESPAKFTENNKY